MKISKLKEWNFMFKFNSVGLLPKPKLNSFNNNQSKRNFSVKKKEEKKNPHFSLRVGYNIQITIL